MPPTLPISQSPRSRRSRRLHPCGALLPGATPVRSRQDRPALGDRLLLSGLLLAAVFLGRSLAAQPASSPAAADWRADPAQAEQQLKSAALAHPADIAAVAPLIHFLNRMGRSDESILLLRGLEPAAKDKNDMLWGETLWLRGETAEARNRLLAVASDPPASWTAAQEQLIALEFLESRLPACEDLCRKVLERIPLNRTARLFLARCLMRMGRFEDAHGLLEAASAADPADLETIEARIQWLESQGKAQEADALCRAVPGLIAKAAPATPGALVAGASALRRLGQLRAAMQCLAPAARSAPADPFVQLERIRLFRAGWNLNEAAAGAEALLRRYPKCALALAEQAENVWRMQLDSQLTASFCERALALDSSLLAARCRLALFQLVAGEWDKAGQLLAANRRLNPADPETARLAQAARLLQTPTRQADAATSQTDSLVALHMGELLLARGDCRGARAWYECALKADPASGQARKGAGVAAFRCGEHDRASRQLDEAFGIERYDIEIKNLLDYLDEFRETPRLEGRRLTVGYPRQSETAARYVEFAAAAALEEELRRYGLATAPPVHVQLCAASDDLKVISQGIIPTCCCGRSDLGREGSIRFETTIYLWTPAAAGGLNATYRLDEALFRSVAHVVIQAALGGQGPAWLREGLAGRDTMDHSPEWSPFPLDVLIANLRAGMQLPLSDLEELLTGERNPFCRVYATLVLQEWSQPRWRDKLGDLLQRVHHGEEWTHAIEQAFGQPLATLDRATREAILERFRALRPEPVMAQGLQATSEAARYSADARIDLATVYYRNKRLADARGTLVPLLAEEAPPTRAALLAGRIAAEQGDWATARRQLELGLELERRRQQEVACFMDYEALGRACLGLNQPVPAAAAFRRAIALNPLDTRKNGACSELIKLLMPASPRPPEYYELLKGQLAARRNDADLRIELARWHEIQGRPEAALTMLASAVGINPEWIEAHRLLAPLALRLKRYDVALMSYQALHLAVPEAVEPMEKLAFLQGLLRPSPAYRNNPAAEQIRSGSPGERKPSTKSP